MTTLYNRFRDTKEKGFRDEFIKPLLARLGFVGISTEHGVNEFGKDFVFSELDRFGRLRNMIVQAKHEEKINQGRKVDDLISQIRQAFFVPFTLASSPSDVRYVSSVYVFNSGTITDNAKTIIISQLPRECAANTHFFSGDQLDALERTTYFQSSIQIRERLTALRNQLGLNIQIWRQLNSGLSTNVNDKSDWDVRGGILHGIEEHLSNPVLPDQISIDEISVLWQRARIIQAISQKHYMLPIGEPGRSKDIQILKVTCNDSIESAIQLIVQITKALNSLPS